MRCNNALQIYKAGLLWLQCLCHIIGLLSSYSACFEYFFLHNPVHKKKSHTSLFWKASEVLIHCGSYHSSSPLAVQLEVRYIATSAGWPPLSRYIFNKLSTQILSKGSSKYVQKMDFVWCVGKVKQAWKMDERFWPHPSLYFASLQNDFTFLQGYKLNSV